MQDSGDDLERRAEAGDAGAAIALAERCERAGKINLSRGWYARAAKLGSVAALRGLAKNLLTFDPIVADHGLAMMRGAAEGGDAEAAYLCALLAAQDETSPGRWQLAGDWAEQAAAQGFKRARAEQACLQASALSPEALARPVALREISERIAIAENFISAPLCEWLMTRARPMLAAAEVYDTEPGKGRMAEERNNSAFHFTLFESDLIVLALRERIAASVKLPLRGLERMAVLNYAPGERFSPHYDFLDPAVPAFARDLAQRGQRVATFLIYLNEDFAGGETDFPKLNYRFKGKTGDAILFWNVTADGAPDRDMLHAGLPPTRGEKWIVSQWLRRKSA